MPTNQKLDNPPLQLGQILVGKGVVSDAPLRIALQEPGKTHHPRARPPVRPGFPPDAPMS